MRIPFIALWMIFGATSVSAQFESLADKDTAKDKLDHFFVQADDLSDCYAIAYRAQAAAVRETVGTIKVAPSSGITIKSTKRKFRYHCTELDNFGASGGGPGVAWRSESLLVGGLERRRSYSVERKNWLPETKTIEPDPETGMRAGVKAGDFFGDFAHEIDPFGLVLGGVYCTRARNSELQKVLRTWITRLELKFETESKGFLLSKWNGFDREINAAGRREIVFDSRVGYLPTALRIFLIDHDGKEANFGIKTTWEKYKADQWRQSQIVVSGYQGPDWVEETFEFAWAEPEALESFLSTQDLNAIVQDDRSDWFKLFAGFLGSQQTNKDKKAK